MRGSYVNWRIRDKMAYLKANIALAAFLLVVLIVLVKIYSKGD